MKKYIEAISKEIISLAIEENRLLLHIEEIQKEKLGIFKMPELAFVYECGKRIMMNAENIFGDNIPKWRRELNLGNGGPTDLVFSFTNGSEIAIEFKMVDKLQNYKNDLNKLSKLNNETIKLFCAVIDISKKSLINLDTAEVTDGRVIGLENENLKVVNKKIFKTNYDKYAEEIYALVGVWELQE